MTEAITEQLIAEFIDLSQKRESQKALGLNDYSLIGSMLKVSDEVRLHTRFIYSLLNPHGRHYQGHLFLKLFLEAAGLKGFVDLNAAKIYKEFTDEGLRGQIDLLITDGDFWVLIENKINAADGGEQIFRYVNYLTAKGVPAEAICMVYLNKYGSAPASYSLHDYQVSMDGGWLLNKQGGARVSQYLTITYRTHIKTWLDRCLTEVGHIGNLSNAITEYEMVRQKICKEYRSNLMSLDDILIDASQRIDLQKYKAAVDLSSELARLQAQWLEEAMINGLPECLEQIGLEFFQLDERNCRHLKGRFYGRGDARGFFENGGPTKNKGVFYGFKAGESYWAVAMLFGSRMLHVGMFPIKIKNAGGDSDMAEVSFEADEERARIPLSAIQSSVPFEVDRHPAINARIPGLISYARDLREEAAPALRDFSGSSFARVIEGLAKYCLGESDTGI